MLRIIASDGINLALTNEFRINFTNFQTYRWARKPIWMPTAKSKRFRVPKRPAIPEDEYVEMKRLFNNYRTHIRSVQSYLTTKYNVGNIASLDPVEIEKSFQKDLIKCNEINNAWNAVQNKLCEEHALAELDKEIEFAKHRIDEKLMQKDQDLELAENIVRKVKEEAKYFITPSTLDQAIKFALDNPLQYDYAIDLDGNKIQSEIK